MPSQYIEVSNNRCFQGQQKVLEHTSGTLGCQMKFGIYLPDHSDEEKFPVLFFLSGITCTEANFIEKSNFQRFASTHKIVVVNCDTSPRNVPIDCDINEYYIGLGAGFYLDATEPKWSKHFKMYSYIVEELVPFIFSNFPVDSSRCGIFGHSMGGHGAVVIGLRNPSIFGSISAFAPICSAASSPLAKIAYAAYLGEGNISAHNNYDASVLVSTYSGPKRTILIDMGTNDSYYQSGDLQPENLLAYKDKNPFIDLNFNWRQNYEHGYFFVTTFMEDHFKFHLEQLA